MATKRKRPAANSDKRTPAADLQSGTYTLAETALRLGIGTTTVYDLIRRGDPPFGRPDDTGAQIHVRLIGGQKRTLVAEVERYLAGAGAAAAV
jgi:Helix-turn-helix domain